MQRTPPPEAVATLDKDRPTYLGKLNREVARWWRWTLGEVDPVPAQVASMSKVTVLKLLGLLTTGSLLKRGAEVQVRVSRWAWALLARLPERGELTSEEIGIVRELGKKAVLVGMGLKEEREWGEGMDEVEAGFDDDDYEEALTLVKDDEIDLDIKGELEFGELESTGPDIINDHESNKRQQTGQIIGPQLPTNNDALGPVANKQDDEEILYKSNGTNNDEEEEGELSVEDLAAAKARMLATLNDSKEEEALQEAEMLEEENSLRLKKSAERWNTKATVDMIITVAGEMYGQRDLLEFRQTWEAIQEA